MATITARVEDDTKKSAQKIAGDLGISLSTLMNMWLKEFIRTKKVSFELDDTDLSWYDDKDIVNFEGVSAKEVVSFLDTQLIK